MAEIYVSTDIEADGPIPGPHSMLSFASVALTLEKQVVGTFSANLELLPGAEGHPDTMAWWKKHPEAWKACREGGDPSHIPHFNFLNRVFFLLSILRI